VFDLNLSLTFRNAAHPITPPRGLNLGRQSIRRQGVVAPGKRMLKESDVGVYHRISHSSPIGLPQWRIWLTIPGIFQTPGALVRCRWRARALWNEAVMALRHNCIA
jgi:hypothetical protein